MKIEDSLHEETWVNVIYSLVKFLIPFEIIFLTPYNVIIKDTCVRSGVTSVVRPTKFSCCTLICGCTCCTFTVRCEGIGIRCSTVCHSNKNKNIDKFLSKSLTVMIRFLLNYFWDKFLWLLICRLTIPRPYFLLYWLVFVN